MKIWSDMHLREFEFWSGGKDTVNDLKEEDLDEIEEVLEELYQDGLDETTLNDIFWFESDWIAEILGYEDYETLLKERK